MEKRTLGRTGLEVSVLGMGGLNVSTLGAGGLEEGCRTVRRALELGVNYVDTAPSYGDSEEVLGIALEGAAQPHFLATKLAGRPQPFDPQDRDLLRRSVDESLRLLRRDCIDILLIHEPDRPGQYDWWTDLDGFHGPVSDLLEELKAEKVIRFTGLGGTTAYQLPLIMATGNYDVVLTAFNYSLLWREAAIAVFPEARRPEHGPRHRLPPAAGRPVAALPGDRDRCALAEPAAARTVPAALRLPGRNRVVAARGRGPHDRGQPRSIHRPGGGAVGGGSGRECARGGSGARCRGISSRKSRRSPTWCRSGRTKSRSGCRSEGRTNGRDGPAGRWKGRSGESKEVPIKRGRR